MSARYKNQRIINPRILKQQNKKRSQKHQKKFTISFQFDDLSFQSFEEENEEVQPSQNKTNIKNETKKVYVLKNIDDITIRKSLRNKNITYIQSEELEALNLIQENQNEQKSQKSEPNQASHFNSNQYQDIKISKEACNIQESIDYQNQPFQMNDQENDFQQIKIFVGDLNEQKIAITSKPREWSIKLFEEINLNKILSTNFNECKNIILDSLEKENCYLMEFLNSQKQQDLFQGFYQNHLEEYYIQIKYDQDQLELQQEKLKYPKKFMLQYYKQKTTT
ncbi:hypothetical protein ABPG73_017028 [Tetrahymena malaccensis]